ncbi:hypothetical protein [Actinoplanes utahensis]|uniref:hypothetical protein n=1 Tax=Actinoplanes utahensis TaxID=1869 RepID=UPI000690AC5A|nr:hypothetical protein [Actinoplanes utahensis]GIF33857.1 hypothetical protein Aut01nite_68430 [Actinoplanes utahensis]
MNAADETQRWDQAISGWHSDFTGAPAQLRAQRSRLLALVGRRLQAGWVGWDPERDRWQPILPLVLVFDGDIQLELAWQGWDDLSITWNTIDLTTPPTPAGRPHAWRSSQPPPLAAVQGRVLTGWAVTESPYFDSGADLTGDLPMHEVKGWLTHGLWIEFAGTDLHVHNGADTTLIAAGLDHRADQGHVRLAHHQLPVDAAYCS